MFTNNSFNIIKTLLQEKQHKLFHSGRKKLDVNNDNKIDAKDFKIIRDNLKKKKTKRKSHGKNDTKKG